MVKIIDISEMKASSIDISTDEEGGIKLEISFTEDYEPEQVQAYVDQLLHELHKMGAQMSDGATVKYKGKDVELSPKMKIDDE